MGNLTFRGVSVSSLGNVYVSKMPAHRKASMRYSEYFVKGRDGALHVNEGLSPYEIHAQLVLLNGDAKLRQAVNAWADGTGKLISSDDLTLAYQASVMQEIQWSRVVADRFVYEFSSTKPYAVGDFCKRNGQKYRFNTAHTGAWNASHVDEANYLVNGVYDCADITFLCQPHMVEAVDSTIQLSASGIINNPASDVAYPLIQVNGAGNVEFTVNGTDVAIDGMTANTPVFLDCENGYVYTSAGATTMRGEFPVLDIGNNTVTLGQNCSSLWITPHWRWV